jgi:hypothetical protein
VVAAVGKAVRDMKTMTVVSVVVVVVVVQLRTTKPLPFEMAN